MHNVVEIKDLSVTLSGQVRALKEVSLDLPAGKIIGFIGPSGAGKTTLIRTIVGRLKVTEGSVRIFDWPAGAASLRGVVAYMAQEVSIYADLTVRQNIAYFATMLRLNKREALAAVNEVLATVDLTDKAESLVVDLSGGQKQRVSLAIALIGKPPLLVLDEPTVGLDPVLREKLWNLFAELAKQGTTLIISSHSMDEAERCDDLVLIRSGRIIAHSTPAALKKHTRTRSIEKSFLKLVGAK